MWTVSILNKLRNNSHYPSLKKKKKTIKHNKPLNNIVKVLKLLTVNSMIPLPSLIEILNEIIEKLFYI